MIIEQTVNVPASRHVHLDFDLPPATPMGRMQVIIQFPAAEIMLLNESALAKDWKRAVYGQVRRKGMRFPFVPAF